MGSQAQREPQCPGRTAGTQPGQRWGCAQQPGQHQQRRRLGASVPQLSLHSSLILGYSSSQAPAAKSHLKKRFGEKKEVAELLGACRAMTTTLAAEPWSF